MGCDGGTIPRRDELVKVKKKPEQKDKNAELAFRWQHCTINQLPLQSPIVACGLGRLYSKESILEGLLDRTVLSETALHIKSLKDVKTLNLTPNPAYDNTKPEKGDCYVDNAKSPYICPVIGLEMNGKYKFCFLWSCGCVMSERAFKAVKTTTCHKCQQPYEETDIIVMNAEGDDLQRMEQNLAARKAERKASKKRCNEASGSDKNKSEKKKVKKEEKTSANKSDHKKFEAKDPAYEKTNGNYSVAKDPEATEVFKSIFTSHKSASEQVRAHWVTYNPFYN